MTKAGATNFSNDILGYNKLDAGQADLQTAKSGAWTESSLYTMLRAIYTFNDKYIVTGTVRRDGFSGKTTSSVYFPPLLWHGVSAKKTSSKIMWTGWRT